MKLIPEMPKDERREPLSGRSVTRSEAGVPERGAFGWNELPPVASRRQIETDHAPGDALTLAARADSCRRGQRSAAGSNDELSNASDRIGSPTRVDRLEPLVQM